MLTLSCQKNDYPLKYEEETFAKLYAEMILVHIDYERLKENNTFYNKQDTLKILFDSYGYSPESFDKQFKALINDPERWSKIQDHSIKLLNQQRDSIVKYQSQTRASDGTQLH